MKRMRIQYGKDKGCSMQYGKDEGCSMERMKDAVWKG